MDYFIDSKLTLPAVGNTGVLAVEVKKAVAIFIGITKNRSLQSKNFEEL